MTFKEKLFRLPEAPVAQEQDKKHTEEMTRMIRYGAMGELGSNYYLYIYRDIYRHASYYGAVIFLNKPDELGNPVRIICLEADGIEQQRKIYIRAALYFLKNQCTNTMSASGKITDIITLAHNKINTHLGHQTTITNELEDFNFNSETQEITSQIVEIKKISRSIENQSLQKQLEKLQTPFTSSVDALIAASKPKALLGLNLKIDFMNFSGKKDIYFYPVLIIKNDNNTLSEPKRLLPGDIEKYDFIELTPLQSQIIEHFSALDSETYTDPQRTQIMNRLYFRQLINSFFSFPSHLLFCQSQELSKTFNPITPTVFHKVHVRFAPSLKRETVFLVRLRFINNETGMESDAGDKYTIKILNGFIYIFFISSDGVNYLAVPEDPKPFLNFFNFLAESNEFFTCDFPSVLKGLQNIQSPAIALDDQLLNVYKLSVKPIPTLKIHPEPLSTDKGLEIDFDYLTPLKKYLETHPGQEICFYDTDNHFEEMAVTLLKTDPHLRMEIKTHPERQTLCYYFYFKSHDYHQWLINRGDYYINKGFRLYLVKWNKYIDTTRSSLRIDLETDRDWLAFKPVVKPTENTEETILVSVSPEINMATDKKGKLHLLTKEDIEKLSNLMAYGESHGDSFRIPAQNYILIDRLYDERMDEIPQIKTVIHQGQKLKNFQKIGEYPLSSDFKGELREYQQAGFNWLLFLHEYGFSGCLADDMGLGKTVQTLALLQTLKSEKKLKTSLLVAPVSAIPNWEMEISKFTRNIKYNRHLGVKRSKDTGNWDDYDLLITSYATMRNDIGLFSSYPFDYIILDESQNIKNHLSQVSKSARILKGHHRLALSGTPIENTSVELWTLFDYLMPGFLGTSRWFIQQFASEIEREKNEAKADSLKKMIYPFILRRRKQEVERELPEKTEIISRLTMEEEQAQLYTQMASVFRNELETDIDQNGVGKSSLKILEKMLRLRQLCLFPQLVDQKFNAVPSAKFDHFTGLLEDILAENHKVLVFSQFVEVLQILKSHLDEQSIEYSYIDGSTPVKSRGETIKAFQKEPERRVFLLSLKAGGVAINLTAADYVVIFDPWWNPAVEAQAIDRSHRIGQTKKVFVYRMVVADTIEEKMLQLQDEKKELVDNLITLDEHTFKNLKKEDILNLFK